MSHFRQRVGLVHELRQLAGSEERVDHRIGPYVWRELQHQELPELQVIMSMDDFSFIHLAEPYKGNVEHVMSEPSTLTENTFFSLVRDGEIDLDSLALINRQCRTESRTLL